MSLQLGEIIKWILAVQAAGMNQTHEQITDVSAMFGFVKQGVFAMTDASLERLFADVVIQWGAGDKKKPGKFLPMIEHIEDGRSQI